MLNNTLKEKMAKRPVFGMTIYSNFPPVIENLAYYGFDFAFIDAEHCPWEVTSLREAVLAARFAGISPLVRVTKPDMIEIRKAFEMGAEGVIVPHVKTAEDVKLCVKAGKFPPKGRRGFDMTVRSAHYGVGVNSADYIQHTFDTEMIIPMAEDFEFMDNINEILAVEGVDAINFGPADYSMSTNRPSGYDMKNSDTDAKPTVRLPVWSPMKVAAHNASIITTTAPIRNSTTPNISAASNIISLDTNSSDTNLFWSSKYLFISVMSSSKVRMFLFEENIA